MSAYRKPFPQLMSYRAVAKKLAKSPDTIKRWSRESKMGFPAPRYLNGCAVFYEKEIREWLDSTLTHDPETAKQRANPGLKARGLA